MTPWSVRPSAGCPSEAARSASASIGHAPSSTVYSEWTWRWAKLIRDHDPRRGGGRRERAIPQIRATLLPPRRSRALPFPDGFTFSVVGQRRGRGQTEHGEGG